ncbi:MAG TPA: rhodanese-like domain-containing protein [Spirochaetota bacterium]|nr:rhodanese-like domain-containing protein [Spirochaetota bacterium]HPJ38118.1 rhodanese-like domain-containing protein [Spirochaetota bacterium]HPQ54208.1 rhodanese-like domain-containing protein [Spirochaetota bacterium]
MKKMDDVLRSMTFDFFGSGSHKVSPSAHISDSDGVVLDVRSKEEYETVAFPLIHHIPVIHIPIDEIPSRIGEIPNDRNIGTFCSSGVRATMVYFYLRALGYDNVRIIEGGYEELVSELKPGKLLKQIKS